MDFTLPSTWQSTSLRSVCEPAKQWNPSKEPRKEFWYVDVSAVSRESYAIKNPQLIQADTAPSRARKIIKTNDVIFATVRPTLRRVALVGSNYNNQIASTAFCIVRPKQEAACPQFIYYLLLTDFLNEAIALHESGASYPAVNDRHILDQEIFLPPKLDQEKIATILSKVKASIDLQNKLISAARDLKQSALSRIFTTGLHGEEARETEIGFIPQSWNVVELGSLCSSCVFGPRFSSGEYSDDGALITLRTTDISDDGDIVWEHAPAANLNPKDWQDHLLQLNDCVVTRSGTCGIVAVFEGHNRPVLPGAFLIRVRLNEGLMPHYFRYFGNSPAGREQMNQLAQGAIQKNISGTRLKTFKLPLPSIAEQTEIVNFLKTIDKKILFHERKRDVIQELFLTLLNNLMTGQIIVSTLDIDTSVLPHKL